MTQRRVIFAFTVLGLIGVVAGEAYFSWRNNQPVYIFGEGAAKADPTGPAYAKKRAAVLIQRLKECGDDLGQIGLDNLRLPDQNTAEDPAARLSNTSAWTIPSDACFANVAVYTDLYAKRNHTYFKGNKMNSNPTGFFIVGMKNGEVKRVPVADIRLMPYQNREILVFPGVIGYSPTLPPFPSYQTVKQH